jgi:hypothetical protein
MFYYFKVKHKLLEVKLEFKRHDYVFHSYEMYEMQLYSAPFCILWWHWLFK